MLNLIDPIRYTANEQDYVNNVLKPLKKAGWNDQKHNTKDIKHRIAEHTIVAQGCRCAYCESMLLRGAHAIEHIAPMSIYGEFCFEPFNLVAACSSCNSPSNKSNTDTIKAPVNLADYSANRFTVVHPYFDKPEDHIKYQDEERTIFDMTNCSEKGLATIKMFNWNTLYAYRQRVATARTRDLPIDILQIVAEIVTYK